MKIFERRLKLNFVIIVVYNFLSVVLESNDNFTATIIKHK